MRSRWMSSPNSSSAAAGSQPTRRQRGGRKSGREEIMSNDDVNLQDWVGRTSAIEEVASGERASRLASLLGHQSDEAHPLFPLGHWLHFSEDDVPMSELGVDGHVRLGGFMPPVDLPRRMWAGSELAFHAPIMPGQTMSRTTTIESVTE